MGRFVLAIIDRKEVQTSLIVPDYLFFGEEVGKNIDLSEWYGDKKKKKVSARGIIDILKRYNFTVEENTPFDQDVSLDPELLGKVFENLLASYNPETQTTARKQTGSFYTPREIVQYMVDESLVAHLKRTVGDELEPKYRALLQYTDEEVSLTDAQKKRIIQSLYTCKILDPACGSGAFPVGMLQQMVHILSRIDPNNEQWKDMILDEATKESRNAFKAETKEDREERLKDIERSFDEKLNNPDYARKLYLIENCIYGVDIQPIAIQISKLRFFISLVVDQRTTNDPASNFGIRPLPNLEAKFVAANTLIPLAKADANLGRTQEIMETERLLKEANHKIFNAKTVKTKRKWKDRLKELRSELIQQLSDNGFLTDDAAIQLASCDMFDQNSAASFFDADWMFGIKKGFDIVIANPPYVSSKDLNTLDKTRYKNLYKTAEKQFDLYSLFIEKGIRISCEKGVISYIVPDSVIGRSNFSSVRNLLVIDNTIKRWVHLNNVFESAVVSSLIFITQKQKEKKYSFIYEKSDSVKDWMQGDESKIVVDVDFVKSDAERKIYFASQEKLNLQNKLCSAKTFGDKCILWRGEEIGKSSSIISDKRAKSSFPIITGKEARRYELPMCTQWINVSDVVKLLDNYKHNKILIRQVGDCINATIDKHCGITTQSVYALYPKSLKEMKHLNAVLGVLNSKLFDFFYRLVSGDKQMFARIILENIKALPYPDMTSPLISEIDDKVEDILKKSTMDKSSVENEIDFLVYRLYGLTYDEILIVDPDTPITREEYEF